MASHSDSWMAFDYSRQLAASWGAALHDIDHTAFGCCPWPVGKARRDHVVARPERLDRITFGLAGATTILWTTVLIAGL